MPQLSKLCSIRFHPNLILGGTFSGQIVLWDNRVQKRTPIQRTPLSASAHTVSSNYFVVLKTFVCLGLKKPFFSVVSLFLEIRVFLNWLVTKVHLTMLV